MTTHLCLGYYNYLSKVSNVSHITELNMSLNMLRVTYLNSPVNIECVVCLSVRLTVQITWRFCARHAGCHYYDASAPGTQVAIIMTLLCQACRSPLLWRSQPLSTQDLHTWACVAQHVARGVTLLVESKVLIKTATVRLVLKYENVLFDMFMSIYFNSKALRTISLFHYALTIAFIRR